jgi:hypothetical protein
MTDRKQGSMPDPFAPKFADHRMGAIEKTADFEGRDGSSL